MNWSSGTWLIVFLFWKWSQTISISYISIKSRIQYTHYLFRSILEWFTVSGIVTSVLDQCLPTFMRHTAFFSIVQSRWENPSARLRMYSNINLVVVIVVFATYLFIFYFIRSMVGRTDIRCFHDTFADRKHFCCVIYSKCLLLLLLSPALMFSLMYSLIRKRCLFFWCRESSD